MTKSAPTTSCLESLELEGWCYVMWCTSLPPHPVYCLSGCQGKLSVGFVPRVGDFPRFIIVTVWLMMVALMTDQRLMNCEGEISEISEPTSSH